jgi:hypothetical protein
MIYHTRGEHANHYTTDAVISDNVLNWLNFDGDFLNEKLRRTVVSVS